MKISQAEGDKQQQEQQQQKWQKQEKKFLDSLWF